MVFVSEFGERKEGFEEKKGATGKMESLRRKTFEV